MLQQCRAACSVLDYWTVKSVRLLYELVKQSFQRHLTYRAAAAAGLATNVFFGLLRVAILLALYGGRQEVEGLSQTGIITYTALTQALIAYLSLFSWYDLSNSVHSGEVATDLLKPMGFFQFWMAQDLGRALVSLLLRGTTFMIIYAMIFDLSYPSTAVQWLTLPFFLLFSWLISFSWRFLINLPAFWTPNAIGIARFGFVISWFFSGFLMPLRLLPEWLQQIARLTPFPYMLNTLVEVYLGILDPPAILAALALQMLWAAGLILAALIVLRAGVKHLVILGG